MFKRFLTDRQVERCYVRAGAAFGDAVSYIYLGECVGFSHLLNKWEKWEKEYAHRGYRTLPLDDFIEYGGYGKELTGLGEVRRSNEDPVFHASIYRERYLGKVPPAISWRKLLSASSSQVQKGVYHLPSTKDSR